MLITTNITPYNYVYNSMYIPMYTTMYIPPIYFI